MTAVGWIGLGKLGAPCAAALAYHGSHVVYGYDVRGTSADAYDFDSQPAIELCDSIDRVVAETDDVVYVAVQTPHSPAYGGETIVPTEPRDFEYSFLVNAVRSVCAAALRQRKYVRLIVVSTVLPGTFDRLLRPLLNEFVNPVYHPFFIAMGTVVDDFVKPEMTLFGADDPRDVDVVRDLYNFHGAPAPVMSIASAELTKVAYNTFISTKIVFANALMELCDHTGADVDDVTEALARGTDRIISSRYLRAGMGDGGACHPRDNVALSALAQRFGVSVDLMGFLTRARESQTGWLAGIAEYWSDMTGLPLVVLGKSYKPDVESTAGSPALLLAAQLRESLVAFEHYVIPPTHSLDHPKVFFIATRHAQYADLSYPVGSVVIDPFGYVVARPGVTLVTPGRKK